MTDLRRLPLPRPTTILPSTMPTVFYADHQGRRIELVPESSWQGDRVHLLIDGERVAMRSPTGATPS